ncbi:MAG: PEP-CTERM sorting domain-containing protein [Moorea sp. SIO4A3]|nr:PEP-CTERM sorting domain-containing protein [Moorena sp. SIO4A3]
MSIKHSIKHSAIAIAAGAIGLIGLSSIGGAANAATIVNGGFEEGFRGWKSVDQTGSRGSWAITNGANTPFSGPIPGSSQGSFYNVTHHFGPGSHVLFQDIVLEAGFTHELSFDWFAQDFDWSAQDTLGVGLMDAGTMDFNVGANQHFRVDLVSADFDDWFGQSSDAGVLANILSPVADPSPVNGFNTTTFDLTPWAGSTVRLAFRQVQTQLFLNSGVDAVSIKSEATSESTSVPEPASVLGLLAVGVGCVSLKKSKIKSQKLK